VGYEIQVPAVGWSWIGERLEIQSETEAVDLISVGVGVTGTMVSVGVGANVSVVVHPGRTQASKANSNPLNDALGLFLRKERNGEHKLTSPRNS